MKLPKWLNRSLTLMLSLALVATNFVIPPNIVQAADTGSSAITTSDTINVIDYENNEFVVDPNLELVESVLAGHLIDGTKLNGASVMIGNVKSGDMLSFTDPAGIITGIYNPKTGILTLKGEAEIGDYQTALQNVTFSTTSTDVSAREITFTLGSALSFAGTGHFYEYISKGANITWQAARAEAASKSYFGRQGYLVTITSQEENDFVKDKTEGLGWIGAADIIRLADPAIPAIQGGDWRWIDGPEGLEDNNNGLAFWKGYIDKWPAGTAGPVENRYNNWQGGKEPNDYQNTKEYVAHIFGPGANSGQWNDYPPSNSVTGYVIEYGGMKNDKTFAISATKTIEDPLSAELKITAPSGDPAQVTVPAPEIKGEGKPGSSVKVIIKDKDGKEVIGAGGDAQVQADGTWTYTSAIDLAHGEYIIEAQAKEGTKIATKTQKINVVLPAPELETAELEQITDDDNKIVLTFDEDVDLTSPKTTGFIITVGGQEVPVNDVNFNVDPSNPKKLIITLPAGTDVTQKEVNVTYDGTGNLKGTNGAPVQDFTRVAVDKSLLKAKVDEAIAKVKEDYTSETWTDLQEALTEARSILEKKTATQEEVNNALAALEKAYELLELVLEITEPTSEFVFVPNPSFTGKTAKGAEVKVTIKKEDGSVIGPLNAEVDDEGNWTLDPADDLADGKYTIEVIATKGDIWTNEKKEITVDTSLPRLEITEPSGDTVYTTKPKVKGITEPNGKVTIVLTDEQGKKKEEIEVTADSEGNWIYKPSNDLGDGKYKVEASATKDGKPFTVGKEITVDSSLPKLEITGPSSGTVYTAKPEIKGTADKEAEVKVTIKKEDGTKIGPVKVDVAEDGTWIFIPSDDLEDGKYTFEVTAEKHGKVSEKSKDITVDTTKVVDKSALKQKTEEINGKIAAKELTESNYTPTSWANLERELIEANLVLSDPGATQDQLDQALIELQKALDNLVVLNGELEDLDLVGLTNDGVQAITLEPTFDPDQYKNYQGTVTNDVYGISLNPTVQDPNEVRVFVNGVSYSADEWNKLPLKEGKNVITVGVYDKDGNRINDYTITIYRGDEANKLESLVPSVGSLYPAFDPNQDTYTMNVANSVNQLQLTPTAQDPNATIQIRVNNGEWKTVTSGELSDYLALNVGPNSIEIKVTDQNGKDKTYNVTVSRAYDNDNSGGGNTGGGNSDPVSPTTPPTTDNTVKPGNIVTTVNGSNASFASGTVNGDQTTVTIDSNKLSGILVDGKGHKLGIRVPGNGNVEVRGLTLEDLKKIADTGSSLDIEDLLAIYPVPAGQLDVNAISKQFGNAPISNIAANIKIKRSADDVAKPAREKATQGGYELLVHPVDLDLSFMHDGKTDRAGLLKGYAPKYIALPEGIDPNRITTGVIVNPDGSIFHVPTVVTKIDNRYFALINDLRSSGSYSVIWNPKDFDDVQYHWGRADVNNIAARLSLKGNGDNTFSPKRHVTRSEFAEIMVLGLGLMRQDAPQNIFPDVPASAWYRNAVALADEFGIVRGYDNGNFKGNQEITREQGFAMIARAYRLIQSEDVPNQEQIASAMAPYADGTNVAAWAQGDVAQLVNAGIIQGNGPKLLSPKAEMTRAEVTALIARMLKVTNLIDK